MPRDRVVYSTEQGRICLGCGNPVNQCTCRKQTSPSGDGNLRVSRETKGRKGKGVTLIKGLDMDAASLSGKYWLCLILVSVSWAQITASVLFMNVAVFDLWPVTLTNAR